MRIIPLAGIATLGTFILLVQNFVAAATEVKVLSAIAMSAVVKELGPEFERVTGHRLGVKFDVTPVMKRKIDAGEPFDVAVSTRDQIDELIAGGKVNSVSRVDIARSGMGVAVRAGAPKPDVSSVEAFRRALLNAKSVSYSQEGPTGLHLAGVLQRLGIAEEVKSKTKLQEGGARVVQCVANGECELGFTAISNILLMRGAEIAGPFPPELQSYAVFSAGVAAAAGEREGAQALIRFLTSPTAATVVRAAGMEPTGP